MSDLQISDPRLELAVRAAKEAGERAASVKTTTSSERKGNDSIVTAADREAESIVREHLRDGSDHPIFGEEYGGDIADEDTYWVVDPIDGTRNFSYEQPFYGCAVALVAADEPTVGVWYMPELDYLFYAVAGRGAYRGDERLSVSDERDLARSYPIVTGKGRERIYPAVARLTEGAQQVGSAVMTESWVASGWSDVGVLTALAPWDMAAGVVLVREAGGVLKTVADGETDWAAVSEGRVVVGAEPLVDAVRAEFSPDEVETVLNTEYDW
jgi:myo-inositol-1(or 4)-monophosphatase